MTPVAGARALQVGGHSVTAADLKIRHGVQLPAFLVEVAGQEPAGVVLEQREYPDGLVAGQVVMDDLVGQGQVLARLAFAQAPRRIFAGSESSRSSLSARWSNGWRNTSSRPRKRARNRPIFSLTGDALVTAGRGMSQMEVQQLGVDIGPVYRRLSAPGAAEAPRFRGGGVRSPRVLGQDSDGVGSGSLSES